MLDGEVWVSFPLSGIFLNDIGSFSVVALDNIDNWVKHSLYIRYLELSRWYSANALGVTDST
jgi:hypothetical protein